MFSEEPSRGRYQRSPTGTFRGRCWRDTALPSPPRHVPQRALRPRRLGTKPGSPQQAAPGQASRREEFHKHPLQARARALTGREGHVRPQSPCLPAPRGQRPGFPGEEVALAPSLSAIPASGGRGGDRPEATVTKVAAGGEASLGTRPPRARHSTRPHGCSGDEDVHSCPAGSWDICRHKQGRGCERGQPGGERRAATVRAAWTQTPGAPAPGLPDRRPRPRTPPGHGAVPSPPRRRPVDVRFLHPSLPPLLHTPSPAGPPRLPVRGRKPWGRGEDGRDPHPRAEATRESSGQCETWGPRAGACVLAPGRTSGSAHALSVWGVGGETVAAVFSRL